MGTKLSLVEIHHDEGYGDDLLYHINVAFRNKDMRALSVVDGANSRACTSTPDDLIETNRRLNRRCQELERLLASMERRIVGAANRLDNHASRAHEDAKKAKGYREACWSRNWRGCLVCRFNRAVKHKFVEPQMWVGGKKAGFWRCFFSDVIEWYRGR